MKNISGLSWNKIGKDRLIIGILIGLILLVVVFPTKDKSSKNIADVASDTLSSVVNTDTANSSDQNYIETISSKVSKSNQENGETEENATKEYGKWLQNQLEETLAYIDGVGEVKVMVTMKSSSEVIVEKDSPYQRSNTNELDSQGGKRDVVEMTNEESTIYITDSNGNKIPFVTKEYEPIVEGVLVVDRKSVV